MLTPRNRIVLAAFAFALCYAGVIGSLAITWTTSYAYSYGIAVLLVSAYLLWVGWDRLRSFQAEPDYSFGVPVTLAGIALLVAGRLALMDSLQEMSLVVTIAGLVLLLFGRGIFSVVRFPLAYLLLGIPMWDSVIARLQPASQILSARLGSGLLQLVGVPVLREGTRLILPNVVLEVMRECSGVNQLLAIVAMALPAAYLWLTSNTRRTILVALAAVFAYLSNGARIALVGFLAYRGLSDGNLHSVHLLEGLVISAIGYLTLFGCLSLLSRGERPDAASATTNQVASTPRRLRIGLDLAVATVMLLIGVFQITFRPADVRLRDELGVFPTQIGEWTIEPRPTPMLGSFPAIDDALVHAYPSPTGERHFTDIDDQLVRAYRNPEGRQLHLYIGYHRSQREGKELVGEAGHALNSAAVPLSVNVGSEVVELGQVIQPLQHGARGLLYWYEVDGRTFDNLFLAKKYLVWGALTRRRTNGAVVMVGWQGSTDVEAEQLQLQATAFARAILPVLTNFIPS
jgi:EpsI family protein